VVGGLSLGAILSLLLAAEFPEDTAGRRSAFRRRLFYDGWNVPWTHKLIPLVNYTPLKFFSFFRESEPFGLRDAALRSKVAEQYGQMSLPGQRRCRVARLCAFPGAAVLRNAAADRALQAHAARGDQSRAARPGGE